MSLTLKTQPGIVVASNAHAKPATWLQAFPEVAGQVDIYAVRLKMNKRLTMLCIVKLWLSCQSRRALILGASSSLEYDLVLDRDRPIPTLDVLAQPV